MTAGEGKKNVFCLHLTAGKMSRLLCYSLDFSSELSGYQLRPYIFGYGYGTEEQDEGMTMHKGNETTYSTTIYPSVTPIIDPNYLP